MKDLYRALKAAWHVGLHRFNLERWRQREMRRRLHLKDPFGG